MIQCESIQARNKKERQGELWHRQETKQTNLSLVRTQLSAKLETISKTVEMQ